jgi:MoaA/NifB/PqqE/SkfB family radical SAM enzyme
MGRFNHDHYVEVTMHFRCNLKCVHCMIEGTMDWLKPQSADQYQKILDHNRRSRQWKGIILTGSEVTLRRDLPDLARQARQHGFEHVRIQTHGMRLSDERYCRELVDAGIDEYFISITAADAATHDAITKIPGSFQRTLRGFENLEAFEGVATLSNTVVTKLSYRHLPDLVERLGHLRRLVQMDLWNYWPMRETDDKDLVASHVEVAPYLRRAIRMARALGRAVELKNFPECLLKDEADALDNNQPYLFIDPNFWPEFMRNGFGRCLHRSVCGSRRCLGLNAAYIDKFGWQAEHLSPLPPCAPTTPGALREYGGVRLEASPAAPASRHA